MEKECDRIIDFIRSKNKLLGTAGAVVGLSGGLDSSVCAALIAKALGEDKVLGVIMPVVGSNPEDAEDAENLAKVLHIRIAFHSINFLLSSFYMPRHDFEKEVKPLIVEQKELLPRPLDLMSTMKLRSRMYILGYYAFENNYFQCQTLEKTEWMLGWFDKFGDAAGDIAPIFHLYKTQVRQLAEYLKLPDFVLNRAPGSGNYPLTDEEELGMKLDKVDSILVDLEMGLPVEDIAPIEDISLDKVMRIENQVEFSEIKRQIPVHLEGK